MFCSKSSGTLATPQVMFCHFRPGG